LNRSTVNSILWTASHVLVNKYGTQIFTNDERAGCVPIVSKMLSLSHYCKLNGILALERKISPNSNDFLNIGLTLVIDGTDPLLTREILTNFATVNAIKNKILLEHIIIIESIFCIQHEIEQRTMAYILCSFLGMEYLDAVLSQVNENNSVNCHEYKKSNDEDESKNY